MVYNGVFHAAHIQVPALYIVNDVNSGLVKMHLNYMNSKYD